MFPKVGGGDMRHTFWVENHCACGTSRSQVKSDAFKTCPGSRNALTKSKHSFCQVPLLCVALQDGIASLKSCPLSSPGHEACNLLPPSEELQEDTWS